MIPYKLQKIYFLDRLLCDFILNYNKKGRQWRPNFYLNFKIKVQILLFQLMQQMLLYRIQRCQLRSYGRFQQMLFSSH